MYFPPFSFFFFLFLLNLSKKKLKQKQKEIPFPNGYLQGQNSKFKPLLLGFLHHHSQPIQATLRVVFLLLSNTKLSLSSFLFLSLGMEDQPDQLPQINGEDFYEKIEAPKFVDFTVPDRCPPNDRYWFCLRVGS